ncbi:MAG: aminomethyltransferase family protein [Candidatus Binatia bacterium]
MAKQSLLMDLHRLNGAVFAERDDWLLPAHFGDPVGEYTAARSSAGLVDLSRRGLLQCTGPDRLSFLQGMLSNDLRALQPFTGQYATILTQQGKVVADARVLCAMNSFYLDFWENLKAKITDHLNRYLVADEVEIADRSAEYGFISVQGPRAESLLKTLADNAALPAQEKQHAMITIEGAAVCVVRDNHGVAAFDLIVPVVSAVAIAERLTKAGKQFSAAWVGEDAQNILRIEGGIPRYGVDFNEDNLLLEVGIDHAVSFTKGCYLGQEVVERIRSRGHVNKRLCGLLLDSAVAADAGDQLQADRKEIGKITSSVISPRLGRPIALGYVMKEHWEPGTELSLRHSGANIRATVVKLPLPPTSS